MDILVGLCVNGLSSVTVHSDSKSKRHRNYTVLAKKEKNNFYVNVF